MWNVDEVIHVRLRRAGLGRDVTRLGEARFDDLLWNFLKNVYYYNTIYPLPFFAHLSHLPTHNLRTKLL